MGQETGNGVEVATGHGPPLAYTSPALITSQSEFEEYIPNIAEASASRVLILPSSFAVTYALGSSALLLQGAA